MKPDFRKQLLDKNLGTSQRESSTVAEKNLVVPVKPDPRKTSPPVENIPAVDASFVHETADNAIHEPKARPSAPPANDYGNTQPGEKHMVAKDKVTIKLPKSLILACKDAALEADARLSRVIADDLKAIDDILSSIPKEDWSSFLTDLADKGKEGTLKKACVCLPHELVVATRKKFNLADITFKEGVIAAITKAHR